MDVSQQSIFQVYWATEPPDSALCVESSLFRFLGHPRRAQQGHREKGPSYVGATGGVTESQQGTGRTSTVRSKDTRAVSQKSGHLGDWKKMVWSTT